MKKITRDKWRWFGSAGHFICARWCRFHLCTQVGKYLVSTVGEYWPERGTREIHARVHDPKWLADNIHRMGDDFDGAYMEKFGFETLGASPHCYETMVFKAGKPCDAPKCHCGLPFPSDYSELDGSRWMTPKEATQGHYKFCEKFASAAPPL